MSKTLLLLCFVALFGASIAQLTVTTLVNATSTAGTLGVVLTDYEAERQGNSYKIWLGGNVKTVTVTITKTDTVCSYINWGASQSGVPCNSDLSVSGFEYPCQSVYDSYVSTSTASETQVFGPSSSDSHEVGFAAGDWFFVTAARESYDKDKICAYTVTVTVQVCPIGEVGFYDSGIASPGIGCAPIAASLATSPFMGRVNLTTEYQQNRVWIPRGTAYVHFTVYNSTDSLYLYGINRAGAGNSNYYCYELGGTPTDEIDLYCHFPEEGWFYYEFNFYYTFNTGDWIDFVYTVDTKVCSATSAGFNCTAALSMASTVTAAQTFTLPAYVSGPTVEYPAAFFYMDYVNGSMTAANFTVTATAGSGYIVYRRNAFPGYSSQYYQGSDSYNSFSTSSTQGLALVAGDTWTGGRYYFAVINSGGSTALTFTIASSSISATSAASAGTTTDVATTTGAASSVFAPLALIALLIAALL